MRENRTYGSEGGEAKAFPTPMCVREGALSARWKSALGLVVSPEVESNCVAARRGGKQLEANRRSVG